MEQEGNNHIMSTDIELNAMEFNDAMSRLGQVNESIGNAEIMKMSEDGESAEVSRELCAQSWKTFDLLLQKKAITEREAREMMRAKDIDKELIVIRKGNENGETS